MEYVSEDLKERFDNLAETLMAQRRERLLAELAAQAAQALIDTPVPLDRC